MANTIARRLVTLCVIAGSSGAAFAQERSSNTGAIGRSPAPRYIYPDPTRTGIPVALEDFTSSSPPPGARSTPQTATRPAGPGDLRKVYPEFERPFPTGVTRHTPERGYQRPFSGTQGFQRPFAGSNGFQRPMEARPSRHSPMPSRPGQDRSPLHTGAPSVNATTLDVPMGLGGGGGGSRGPSRAFGPPGLAGPDGIGTAPIGASPAATPQSVVQLPAVGGVSASTTVSAPAGTVITGLPGLSTGLANVSTCDPAPLAVRTPTNESLSRVDVLYGPTSTLDELKPSPLPAEAAIPTPQERLMSALARADYQAAGAAVADMNQVDPESADAQRLAAVIQMLGKDVAAGALALEKAYVMDPTLAERPVDFKGLGIRGSDISTAQATLQRSARSIGEARSAFAAAVLQQSRGDVVVARRFLDRAVAAGLAPELSIAMGRALTMPSAPMTAGRVQAK